MPAPQSLGVAPVLPEQQVPALGEERTGEIHGPRRGRVFHEDHVPFTRRDPGVGREQFDIPQAEAAM